jgi:hypothetical protein
MSSRTNSSQCRADTLNSLCRTEDGLGQFLAQNTTPKVIHLSLVQFYYLVIMLFLPYCIFLSLLLFEK